MADYAGAVAAIFARLQAQWTATPLAFPNGARPAELDPDTGLLRPWVYAEVIGAGSTIVGAGVPRDHVYVYDGLIKLHVFTPSGTDAAVGFQHAVALGEIFRTQEFYNETSGHCVRSWSPRVDDGGDGDSDGLWFRVTTTIPFEYWHRG
ncbi:MULTISPECIES: phage tail terminator-like protein [unclassified Chelatococcus]|uniref:phage tail terminator-like protein n=1 Tax=unclassified Chelatococcus TaxID=2638111 RepID=UPI001BCB6A05|nr:MULTISPECIES: phage tail terminator-like protein [unclassified Chelatococcus]MBS7699171.1 hypothetical protein [Chelatococcus sp. YT9]MBX3554952.1 hypothetical protein [Chelatococcus sp.]